MSLATLFALFFCVSISICCNCNPPGQPSSTFIVPQWQWQQPRFPLAPIDPNLHKVWFPRPNFQPQTRPAVTGPGTRDCGAKCPCPYDFNPICGSNGVTYDNNCELQCQRNCYPGLRIFKKGTCS